MKMLMKNWNVETDVSIWVNFFESESGSSNRMVENVETPELFLNDGKI